MQSVSIAELIPRGANMPELSVLLDRIQAVYKPRGVVLFGSRARGTAHPDSDWDLLVVLARTVAPPRRTGNGAGGASGGPR